MTAKPGELTEKPGTVGAAASGLVSSDAAQPLHDALERLSLKGAIFLRAEYTEPWALGELGGPGIANLLHPGAARLATGVRGATPGRPRCEMGGGHHLLRLGPVRPQRVAIDETA